jgi:hypothetical protein
VPEANTHNVAKWEGGDREDNGFKSAQVNSSQDPTSKKNIPKWSGGVAKVVEHLLCEYLPTLEAQSPEVKPHSNKKKFNF